MNVAWLRERGSGEAPISLGFTFHKQTAASDILIMLSEARNKSFQCSQSFFVLLTASTSERTFVRWCMLMEQMSFYCKMQPYFSVIYVRIGCRSVLWNRISMHCFQKMTFEYIISNVVMLLRYCVMLLWCCLKKRKEKERNHISVAVNSVTQ